MPIEDVDYLRQHSIKQSYMFLVDSADRDKAIYPTPSEYSISFTTPFQSVVGFEVLDASIPRTMYNIGGGDPLYPTNNTIAFYVHDDTVDIRSVATSRYIVAAVEPGDYTIQTLVAAVNSSQVLQMHVNNDQTKPLARITIETVSNPPDVKNLLRFRCSYPFVIDMKQSAMSEALGFDTYTDASTEAKKAPTQQRYTTFLPTTSGGAGVVANPQLYHSVDIPPTVGLGAENTVFDGPRGVVRRLPLSSLNSVAQSFIMTTKGYLTGVAVALTTASGIVEGSAEWELRENAIDSRNVNHPGARITLSNTRGILDTNYIDGGLTVTTATSPAETPIFATLLPGIYWIVVTSLQPNGTMSMYYNDVPISNNTLATTMMVSTNGGGTYNGMDDIQDGIQFNASMRVTTRDNYHVLTAPGIYSLVGERYTVLRCKEIEENSYRSLAYSKHCLGLAKFRLGVVGYSENRLDFSKVPTREFHPIGKLSRLSFRFETSTGLLYDFKGVNHTITFAIHYFEPVQKAAFTRSILNPNYTGEFMKDMDNELEDDSDDQEYDYSQDNITTSYKAREARHLPDQIQQLDLEAMHRFALDDEEETS